MSKTLILISLLILLSELIYGKELVGSKNFGAKSSSIEFIQNVGQFKYSDGKKAEEVLFVANTEFGRILVKKTGLSFLLRERVNLPDDKKRKDKMLRDDFMSEKAEFKVSTTELLFNDGNPEPEVESYDEAGGYNNYYLGSEAFTFVKSYKKLVLKDVYPKIDFVIYTGENKSLEYDFVLSPGAKPEQIGLKINNYSTLSIDASNNLLIKNELGILEHSQPKSFVREKNPANQIQSTFALGAENILKFDIPSYNSNEKLIIDPIIRVYGFAWGKAKDDRVNGIAVDSSGNAFVCGPTGSPNLEVTASTFYSGEWDGYIVKLDPLGYKLWATYFGSSNNDGIYGVSVDKNGDILIAGYSNSNDLELTSFQKRISGLYDACVIKFDEKGRIKWSRFLGTKEEREYGQKIQSDKNYIYLQVYTGEAFDGIRLYKMNYDGSLIWQTDYKGNNIDICQGMALDKSGNIYIVGETGSPDLPNSIGIPYVDLNWDGFLAKFDNNGKNLWTKYISSPAWDGVTGVATDDSGFVYVSAYSSSPSLITNKGDRTKSVNYDILVLKYSPDAKLIWGEYYGSLPNGEKAKGIALDRFNNIYLIGSASNGLSEVDTLEANVYRTDMIYGAIFVMKLNNAGKYIWNTYITGSKGATPVAICVDREQNVLIAGTTWSIDVYDINRGSLYYTFNPAYNDNVIVFKLANPVVIQSIQKNICRYSSFEINYIVNDDTLSAQNEMIAEISDENGNFSKPLIIGRQINNKSGKMTAFVPETIKLGTKYSVRIRYRDTITTPEDWKNITISDMPDVKASGNQKLCRNEMSSYFATKESILEYNWSVDGKGKLISKPDSESVTIEWIEAGQGQVFLSTRKRASGCIQYDTINVTVFPLPEITGDSAFSICINDAAKKLDVLKPEGGKYSGKGINNGFFYPDSAGLGINKISYSYSNENGCKNIIEILAKVNPKPITPKISSYAGMIVSSEDTGNEWFLNDTLLEGAKGKRISNPQTGKYSLRIRDTNGCVSDMTEYLDYISDVEENNTQEFSIQPNPAGDYVEITLPCVIQSEAKNPEIRIYNVFGQEVKLTPSLSMHGEGENNPLTPFSKGEYGSDSSHSQLSIFNSQLRVDVSTLVPGLYFVRVGEKVGKFIKY